jgi:hypothetical protein
MPVAPVRLHLPARLLAGFLRRAVGKPHQHGRGVGLSVEAPGDPVVEREDSVGGCGDVAHPYQCACTPGVMPPVQQILILESRSSRSSR